MSVWEPLLACEPLYVPLCPGFVRGSSTAGTCGFQSTTAACRACMVLHCLPCFCDGQCAKLPTSQRLLSGTESMPLGQRRRLSPSRAQSWLHLGLCA